ncbi:hypothetical protein OWV82_011594 [Melia azedarach]|uniref:Uncharacterized protein n=1 Tax=Melia azedarach TaxID=155640 RepID=A0ACC1XYS8_MELAZ|nr:hypothetical protein OWV82_011594 [Melia azedarach]
MSGGNLKERVELLENIVGAIPPEGSTWAMQVEFNKIEIANLRKQLEELASEMSNKLKTISEDVVSLATVLKASIEELESEVKLVKRAFNNISLPLEGGPSKIKVSEPRYFEGARDAKELENFLWDMEQYFKAAKVPYNEQVSITTMYLRGDAKLWWRTRTSEDGDAQEIETWDSLKRELKAQFLPSNAGWRARELLKDLKQTGLVRDYVKQFSSLMLDIKNMSDEDKLFNFVSGLQPWAQTELRRQAVRDLPSAMAAAEGLVDLRFERISPIETKRTFADKRKTGTSNQKNGTFEGESSKTKPVEKKSFGCFICNGPHRARECPKREQLNVMVMEEEASKTKAVSESVQRLNPLQQRCQVLKHSDGMGRLLYTKAFVNGREIKALLDIGATGNYLAAKVVHRMGVQTYSKQGFHFFLQSKAYVVPHLQSMFIMGMDAPRVESSEIELVDVPNQQAHGQEANGIMAKVEPRRSYKAALMGVKRGPTKSVLGRAKVDGLAVVESLKNLEIPKRSATSHKHGTSAKPSAPILYGGMLSEPADLQRQECRPSDAVSIKHSKTNLRVCGALWTTILYGAIFGVGSKTSNGIEVLQPSGKKVQQKLCVRDKEFSRLDKGAHEEGKVIGINDRSGLRVATSRFRGADGQRGRCHALSGIVSQFPYVREMAGGLGGVHRADHLEGTEMMSLWASSWNQQGERNAKTCPRTDKGRGLLGKGSRGGVSQTSNGKMFEGKQNILPTRTSDFSGGGAGMHPSDPKCRGKRGWYRQQQCSSWAVQWVTKMDNAGEYGRGPWASALKAVAGVFDKASDGVHMVAFKQRRPILDEVSSKG